MATLNVSLPEQLRNWIIIRVKSGDYASASDYIRDLVREDIRHQEDGLQWLSHHLEPLLQTPSDQFVSVDSRGIQSSARSRLKSRRT